MYRHLYIELQSCKSKIPIFHTIFFNTDISLNSSNTALKFDIFTFDDVLEESVPQICHLGPRLNKNL